MLPRDFRIRKFQGLTGLSYEELDVMSLVEAAHRLCLAVADGSSIIANNSVKHKLNFYTIM